MHLENITGGGQTILGVQGEFKVNYALHTTRRRRSSQALHLGIAKPQMATVLANFTAAMNGTRCDEEEFEYKSPSKLLTITNITQCSGMTLDPADTYAIPLSYIERERVVLVNVYGAEEEIE